MNSFDELLKSLEDLEIAEADMQALRTKLQAGNITVAVMALMKSGKSTLLNAMIGQEFCPATVEPQTATLLRIQHDPNFPEGKLTDANGITLAEGREKILSKIMASNDDRRNAAEQVLANQIEAIQQKASAASMLSPIREGTYCVKELNLKRIVVSIHRMLGQKGLCVVLSMSSRTRTQKQQSLEQYIGRIDACAQYGCHFSYVHGLQKDKPFCLWLWSTSNGIEFQLAEFNGIQSSSWIPVSQRQEAVMQDAPPRLLRAKCTHGESMHWVSPGKGVRRRLGDMEGWCEVGQEFVVSNLLSTDVIVDYEGYTLDLFSKTRKVQFKFLQGDCSRIVPGEQVLAKGTFGSRLATVLSVDTTEVMPSYKVRIHKGSESSEDAGSESSEDSDTEDSETQTADVELQLPCGEDMQNDQAAAEPDEQDTDELTKAMAFESTKTYTLYVPVKSFEACSQLGTDGLTLMDTPGPNEAHAGLKMELKVALAAADVVIYLIDYTKLGTEDEKHFFDMFCDECGDMLAKDSSRFWFVLNKIDQKKTADDVEQIRELVAKKMCGLRSDFTVTASQILPISAQSAYLSRQASNSRWNTDQCFRNEFEARAVGQASAEVLKKMYGEDSEEDYWKLLQEKFPSSLFNASNFASFEEQVLLGVATSKDRIVKQKVCDAAQSLLTSMQNSTKLTLAALQDVGAEIHQRRQQAEKLSKGLENELKLMETSIYSNKPEAAFVQLLVDHFGKLKDQAMTLIESLFGGPPVETVPGLKFWMGVLGKDRKWHEQVRQKFKSEEQAKTFVDRGFEWFLEVLSNFCQAAHHQILEQLNRTGHELQRQVQRSAEGVVNLLLKQAGGVLKISLQEESLSFSDVLTTDINSLVEQGLAQSGDLQMQEHRRSEERTRFVTKKWYFLGLIPWGTWQQAQFYTVQVTDHFTLDPAKLQQAWRQQVQNIMDLLTMSSKEGVQHLIRTEVQKVTGHIKERCAEISRILCESRAQLLSDQETAEAEKAWLKKKLVGIESTRKLLQGLRSPARQGDAEQSLPKPSGDCHAAVDDCTSDADDNAASSNLPPLAPLCGQVSTTLTLRWIGPEDPPFAVRLDGDFCCRMGQGKFFSPELPNDRAVLDVEVQMKRDGDWLKYAGAFRVFDSKLLHIQPARGRTQEVIQVVSTTTDMGAPISVAGRHR